MDNNAVAIVPDAVGIDGVYITQQKIIITLRYEHATHQCRLFTIDGQMFEMQVTPMNNNIETAKQMIRRWMITLNQATEVYLEICFGMFPEYELLTNIDEHASDIVDNTG